MSDSIKIALPEYNDEIDYLHLFRTVWRGKWLIFITSMLGALLTLIYAFSQPMIYQADALLQVESNKTILPGIELLGGGDSSVETELKIITSRNNLAVVIKTLNLDHFADAKRIPILGNLYRNLLNPDSTDKLPSLWETFDTFTNKYAWGNESIKLVSLDVPDKLLDRELTVLSKEGNKFSLLSKNKEVILEGEVGKLALSYDPKNIVTNLKIKKSKGISPSQIESSYSILISELTARPGTEFIVVKKSLLSTIDWLKKRIEAIEGGDRTGVISLSLEGKNKKKIVSILNTITNNYLLQNKFRSSKDVTKTLKSLQKQLKTLEEKNDKAEASLRKYRTQNQTADMSAETQSVLAMIAEIDTELQTLSLKRDEVGQKYTPSHPTIRAIASQEQKLQNRKKQALSKISRLPKTQQELLRLEQEFKITNTAYINLLNDIQQLKIAEASSSSERIYILDSAAAHHKHVKPKKRLLLALGVIFGAILGMIYLFIFKAFHQKIGSADKLEASLSIPIFASIPFPYKVNLKGEVNSINTKQRSLLVLKNKTSPAIEKLRKLRSNLLFALPDAKNNRVMITAPCPHVGRFFVTSNLATVMAEGGQRVLLIDADIQKGYLHKLFKKKLVPGLSDLITEKASFNEVIHSREVGNGTLDIISRGMTLPNPSQILMHSNFEIILDQLSSEYDLILIDSPSIHSGSEAGIIGKHSGMVFMVVQTSRHSLKELNRAVKDLLLAGIKTKGLIFNGK